MLAHQLDIKLFVAQIPHLVEMLQFKTKNTLQSDLTNREYPCIGQMLSKHHTKGRCRHRRIFGLLRLIDQRKTRIDRKYKTLLTAQCLFSFLRDTLLDRQKQLILLRLGDLCNASARKIPVKLICHICDHHSI